MITNPIINKELQENSGVEYFQKFIPNLVTLGLIVGVVVFLAILIIGAIQWISSGGDKNALGEARQKVTNAIIGIIILFAIFAIIKLLENFLGLEVESIMTLDIGSLKIQ